MSSNQEQPELPKPPNNLLEVQELLKSKCGELLFCLPQRIPSLQQEIQKLRVVARIYKELESEVVDEDLYKEMNLLNRMTVGRDLESEADRRRADEEIASASEKLRSTYGVNADSAQRIARVIGAVAGRTEIAGRDDDIEPQPLGPADIH